MSRRAVSAATTRPGAPPATASTVLSTSTWRISRDRGAPSATRIDVCAADAVPRASCRFARLAHAISSTRVGDAQAQIVLVILLQLGEAGAARRQ